MIKPTLAEDYSTARGILKLACSLVGQSCESLEKQIQIEGLINKSRQYRLNFDIAKITCIPNIFGVYDICLIEFNDIKDSSVCYDACNNQFKYIDTHLWFDNDTLIQFYTTKNGTRSFRICLKPLYSKDRVLNLAD
ncbi:MAG: hypothetical protein RL662_2516 [Bacteroidota bacterium]|jgi:hypothetical protein